MNASNSESIQFATQAEVEELREKSLAWPNSSKN